MKKSLVSISLLALFSLLFGGFATAQSGPTLTVDPDTVEEAGEAELVVSGSGFTAGLDLFVLSCTAPDGDLDAINGQEDCNVQELTPVTADGDGNFEVTVTYNIVEDFAVLAGASAQTESAGALVTISGNGGGGTTTTEAPTSTTEAPTSTTEAPATTTTVADDSTDDGDDTENGSLPDTGSESDLLIGGALVLAAAGVLATRGGQLLSRR
ncbi:MAG: hypothetical protein ACR2QE_13595 [Acidimicrobiales bacterium]